MERRVASGVRVEVGNAAIGPQAVVLMVTGPVEIAVRVVTVLVAAGRLRWLRKSNWKN